MNPYGRIYQRIATIETKRRIDKVNVREAVGNRGHKGDLVMMRMVRRRPAAAHQPITTLVLDVYCPHWWHPRWWYACICFVLSSLRRRFRSGGQHAEKPSDTGSSSRAG